MVINKIAPIYIYIYILDAQQGAKAPCSARPPITDFSHLITDFSFPITDDSLPVTDFRPLVTDFRPPISALGPPISALGPQPSAPRPQLTAHSIPNTEFLQNYCVFIAKLVISDFRLRPPLKNPPQTGYPHVSRYTKTPSGR